MIDTLEVSSRLYGRLLLFYPEDLRRDYGSEMSSVFDEDLECAHRTAGLPGMFRVWRCALAEFIRFALPGRLSAPAVRVPAIASTVFVAAMTAQMSVLWRHAPGVPSFFHALGVALTLPVLLTPGISLLAVWACRSRQPLSLQLRQEHPSCSKSAI
jgi:hypothetical protein